MRRSLVTGGAGFLGSHLCERLLAEGNEVLCLDNYYTGRRANIAHLLSNPSFDVVRHDVCESFNAEVDEIFNLACPASPIHYQSDPVKTTQTCVMGAINMLELAASHNIPILQASTSEVYGNPTVHPQPETYVGSVNTIGPRACYDEGKRCAETLFFDYLRQRDTEIKVVRIFNTYGPRMMLDDGRVVSNLIVQAMRGEPLTVFGDGAQTRSFCYVDDLISGMIKMMRTEKPCTGPINIGNPHEVTVGQLAETIRKMVGSSSPVEYLELPIDDPVRRCPDITKAKAELDWHPDVSLEEGLKKTISYFEAVLADTTAL